MRTVPRDEGNLHSTQRDFQMRVDTQTGGVGGISYDAQLHHHRVSDELHHHRVPDELHHHPVSNSLNTTTTHILQQQTHRCCCCLQFRLLRNTRPCVISCSISSCRSKSCSDFPRHVDVLEGKGRDMHQLDLFEME